MPNAGIQGCRSTSWNSGEAGLNDAHVASVTANTAIDTMSVIHRMSALRWPSALPTKTSSTAPATGSIHEIDNSGRFTTLPALEGGAFRTRQICPLSPKGIAQYQNEADQQ